MNSFQENIENTFFYIFYIQSPPNPRINSFFLKLQPSHFFNFSVLQLHAKFQRKLTRYLETEGHTDGRATEKGDHYPIKIYCRVLTWGSNSRTAFMVVLASWESCEAYMTVVVVSIVDRIVAPKHEIKMGACVRRMQNLHILMRRKIILRWGNNLWVANKYIF